MLTGEVVQILDYGLSLNAVLLARSRVPEGPVE
jgi:hypothetical protein